MNILVTGAKGMVGTALVNNLKNIRDGKNRTRNIEINEIYEYDLDSTEAELDEYCAKADFVFNLAGVNRPENPEDFMKGNFGFASQLLDTLKKHNNKAGIMLSSSVQATLSGRFGNSEYGRSKKAGEELFIEYGKETGAPVYVYRFVNLMGHSRPKYNSAISTFCWAVANDEEFTVNDRSTELEVLYIDDLVEDYLSDSTVTIHLIGEYSAENLLYENQAYIKRELQASLYNGENNTKNGILGIVLPNMYDKIFKGSEVCSVCGKSHNIVCINDSTVVKEFSYNYYIPKDGCSWSEEDRFCVLVKWNDFVKNPELYINKAFDKRSSLISAKTKVRP